MFLISYFHEVHAVYVAGRNRIPSTREVLAQIPVSVIATRCNSRWMNHIRTFTVVYIHNLKVNLHWIFGSQVILHILLHCVKYMVINGFTVKYGMMYRSHCLITDLNYIYTNKDTSNVLPVHFFHSHYFRE